MNFTNLLLFFLISPISFVLASTENLEFSADSHSSLSIENTVGDIEVKSTSKSKIFVKLVKNSFAKHCVLEQESSDQEIEFEVDNKDESKGACDIDFIVSLPKDSLQKIDLSAGSGSIKVSGTDAQIEFSAGSGDISVVSDTKDLEGEAGSGEVSISGKPVSVDLKLGSGDSQIYYSEIPVDADLDIKTGSGNVTVTMPEKSSYRTSYISPSGKLKSELTEDEKSKFKISMMSGSGDLVIKKSK